MVVAELPAGFVVEAAGIQFRLSGLPSGPLAALKGKRRKATQAVFPEDQGPGPAL